MKILLVSPALPNRLHRIRLRHLLDALSTQHQITGVFLHCGKKVPQLESEFIDYVVSKPTWLSLVDCLVQLPLPQPLEVAFCYSPALKRIVTRLASQHDLILVKRLRAVQFVSSGLKTPVVIDTTDAMSLYYKKAKESGFFWQKPLFWEEWLKYRFYERRVARNFKNWIVSSPIDAAYLKKLLPLDCRIWRVPNVVDTNYYKSTTRPSGSTILFSGLLDKYVNKTALFFFLKKVYPLIRQKLPNVHFNIVGPNPPHQLFSYDDQSITITGRVPDIREWIEKSSVVVVPVLVGTGTRNKILQAWSQERPIVTTSIGVSGLEGRDKEHFLLANDHQAFAKATLELLKDEEMAKRIARNGRNLVEEKYSLEVMRKDYEKVFQEVTRRKE